MKCTAHQQIANRRPLLWSIESCRTDSIEALDLADGRSLLSLRLQVTSERCDWCIANVKPFRVRIPLRIQAVGQAHRCVHMAVQNRSTDEKIQIRMHVVHGPWPDVHSITITISPSQSQPALNPEWLNQSIRRHGKE